MSDAHPKLYIHVKLATHFLRWEIPEFQKHFTIVDEPAGDVILLSFGPDVLEEARVLPARKRFATTFPGFSHNPLYNLDIRKQHLECLQHFDGVFINPGPLEIAYQELDNVFLYPFSIDIDLVRFRRYRKGISSLLHVSNDSPQKDWVRSEKVMQLTGMPYEIYPPRNQDFFESEVLKNRIKNKIRRTLHIPERNYLPIGYVRHELVVKKYNAYDGFVHIAKDIKDQVAIDGKVTASLIEAGVTGAILFWHDTYQLGNGLETVFSLSLEPETAAQEILEIAGSIDVRKHSKLTREEMVDTFCASNSVGIRTHHIMEILESA